MYVCIYVCMYFMYVCMYFMYVCMACMYVCMCIYMYVSLYIYVSMCRLIKNRLNQWHNPLELSSNTCPIE